MGTERLEYGLKVPQSPPGGDTWERGTAWVGRGDFPERKAARATQRMPVPSRKYFFFLSIFSFIRLSDSMVDGTGVSVGRAVKERSLSLVCGGTLKKRFQPLVCGGT